MPKRLLKNRFGRMIISLGSCLLVGYFSSLYAVPMISSWFPTLNKPDFIPTLDILAPVAAMIYILLGWAMYFIWMTDPPTKDSKLGLVLFFFGLLLNVFWVYVFFGLRSPFFSLMMMIMLLSVLLSTLIQALRVSVSAALLILPYFIFMIFAAYTNYIIYVMNPNLPLMVL